MSLPTPNINAPSSKAAGLRDRRNFSKGMSFDDKLRTPPELIGCRHIDAANRSANDMEQVAKICRTILGDQSLEPQRVAQAATRGTRDVLRYGTEQ